MYNSLPMDMIEGPLAKVEKIEDKLQLFIDYARKFGVPEVKFSVSTKKYFKFQEFLFCPVEDLLQLGDIPKVTRCLAIMAKMVSTQNNGFCNSVLICQANVKEFEDVTVHLPDNETPVNINGD